MTWHFADLLRIWQFAAISTLLLSCAQGSDQDRSAPGPSRLLPSPPAEWRETGQTLIFSGVALSDYINGGAEAYFAYKFREAAVRQFLNAAGVRLTVEVYEMDRPENAYGIFSTDSAGERWPIGADASYGHGLLRFWKGPYFVRVMCFPTDSSIEAVIRETGAKVADAVVAESKRPEILNLLPEKDFLLDTVCYFHRQTSLNNIRFLSAENLLHLSDDVEALTWEQWVQESRVAGPELTEPGESRNRLRQIVVRYPSDSSAAVAFEDFAGRYLGAGNVSTTDARTIIPLITVSPDEKFAAAGLKAPWLLIVLDADSSESAASAFAQTEAKLVTLARKHEREPS